MPHNQKDQLNAIRHSLAHLLAAAVMQLYPDAKRAIGPAIDNGFYFDFEFSQPISETDLPKIEKRMRKILPTWKNFERHELPAKQAKDEFKNNPYKQELIDEFSDNGQEKVSFYKSGSYWDLCRGGHVDDVKLIDPHAFKLTHTAGAYWRGDAKNKMLTRIYGLAFTTKDELDQYIQKSEEAKLRDHRKLGKELELFSFSPLVGKGLPLWKERGAILRRLLERFIIEEEQRRGYKHVITPDMANIDLYKTSGHYPYYKDSMYAPITIDDEQFMLRPMTCPHHFQLYLEQPRTYKELPMRFAEPGKLYRYEKSGELSGLTRVRSFTLADGHIICTKEQAGQEIAAALELIEFCAEIFGLQKGKDYQYRLSLGDRTDKEKYFKDDAAWNRAEETLRTVLKGRGDTFIEVQGEAAFYGPKIDIQMKNVLGKEDTAFTVQYDFVMPKRFDLKYRDETDKQVETIVVHRSSIGAVERVLAFLLEHYGGWFPFWMAPEQVRVLSINDSLSVYIAKVEAILQQVVIMQPLRYNELRYTSDLRNESLSRKIRDALDLRIPLILIVGPKDAEEETVSVRRVNKEEKVKLKDLLIFLQQLK